MCKIISSANFFIFSKVWFSGFSSSSINAKRKFWGMPHLPYICVWFFCSTMTYFVSIGVIKDRITKMYPKLYHIGKLWPYHLSCFINSFLYDLANMAWLFEKFIFELEDFYSFKITCILVRQEISLKKNCGVISKIYCLILWSPICTPLSLYQHQWK